MQFKSSKTDARLEHVRRKFGFVIAIILIVCMMVVAIVAVRKGDRGPHEGIDFGAGE